MIRAAKTAFEAGKQEQAQQRPGKGTVDMVQPPTQMLLHTVTGWPARVKPRVPGKTSAGDAGLAPDLPRCSVHSR